MIDLNIELKFAPSILCHSQFLPPSLDKMEMFSVHKMCVWNKNIVLKIAGPRVANPGLFRHQRRGRQGRHGVGAEEYFKEIECRDWEDCCDDLYEQHMPSAICHIKPYEGIFLLLQETKLPFTYLNSRRGREKQSLLVLVSFVLFCDLINMQTTITDIHGS